MPETKLRPPRRLMVRHAPRNCDRRINSLCGQAAAPAPRSRREDRLSHRPWRSRERVPGDDRAQHFCRRQYRPLAGEAAHHRTLGSRRAARANCGSQYAWSARTLRIRPLLLNTALRLADQLSATPQAGIASSRTVTQVPPDVALRYQKNGRTLAVATNFRNRESLQAELAMERGRSP